MKQAVLTVVSKLLAFLIIGSVAMSAFHFGQLMQYQKTHPQKKYERNVGQPLPKEAQQKIDMISDVRFYMWLVLPLTVLLYISDHIKNPRGSLITKITKFVNKMSLEEDDKI